MGRTWCPHGVAVYDSHREDGGETCYRCDPDAAERRIRELEEEVAELKEKLENVRQDGLERDLLD